MAEITVPDQDDITFEGPWLDVPAQVNRSAWTGASKTVGLSGAELWTGKVAIGPLTTENMEKPWRAFLFALRGVQNWFRFYLPCNTHSGDRPEVALGAADGYTLPLTGMTPSALILRAGSFMTVPLPSGRYRAVALTQDLTADGSGNATAEFEPALTETPTVGATVETKDPFVPMRSVERRLGLSGTEGVTGTAFDVEEAR